jgi:hypothetical protein
MDQIIFNTNDEFTVDSFEIKKKNFTTLMTTKIFYKFGILLKTFPKNHSMR